MTITKSAEAAASSRFSINSQGVRRSLRLIEAKSCISGAPSLAAHAESAGMPGMISIFTDGRGERPFALTC